MKQTFFFDIDGTLADASHRLPFIKDGRRDWGEFFARVRQDKPIPHMVTLARHLQLTLVGADIAFMSGRPERTRTDTVNWLWEHVLYLPKQPVLYMRPDGDRRDDSIVKSELMDRAIADGHLPLMVFDDRDRVVNMWRARGIPCAQVAEGDF